MRQLPRRTVRRYAAAGQYRPRAGIRLGTDSSGRAIQGAGRGAEGTNDSGSASEVLSADDDSGHARPNRMRFDAVRYSVGILIL